MAASTLQKSKEVLQIAIPSIFQLLVCIFIEVINASFIGHLKDPAKVAGVGLGNVFLNVSCHSIISGLNGAVDTLVSQSYGRKDYYMCGVYLNRGRLVGVLMFLPILVLLLFSQKILVVLHIPEVTAEKAFLYIQTMIPGLVFAC